ncbi:MAG: DUF3108 domain-containing protein [Candidatus Cloacimonetes bacterium]|jgi:hypothetical protein|nr:DUF3108 domain-containing protein [Candidatus Cloacimonadota bacterium]MBT4333316.1 DUF3108 domain-containing protein [Candidatus Cloacimonadota bacterium]
MLKKLIIPFVIIFSIQLSAFEIGEKLTFKIKYGIIKAGEATMQINNYIYQDSTECYKIESLAKTNSFFDNIYKVRDKIESIWDMNKLVTRRFTKKLQEGSYRQYRIHFYYPEQNFTIYTKFGRKTKKFKEKRMDIPANTQDILSALYYLRLQEFTVGDTLTINVTADGRNYPADVIVHRIEKMKTIFGDKNCFVVEPILKGDAIFKQTGKILVWLTADEHKIPVKMSSKIIFGSFKAILKDAKNVPYKKK